ncbi:hypothetical protein LCGC14_1293220 [marine sediment metagenome]|uniref:Uncharacterized protein n=1 Tax=marine sediment metagenome TaxID=412755 RepID=A0A0F9KS06_9ZZZZ
MNLETCERNLQKVTFGDLHDILQEFHKEGRMGGIRFPKRIRDLYVKLTFKQGTKLEINSDLIALLNHTSLHYSKVKVMFAESSNGEGAYNG